PALPPPRRLLRHAQGGSQSPRSLAVSAVAPHGWYGSVARYSSLASSRGVWSCSSPFCQRYNDRTYDLHRAGGTRRTGEAVRLRVIGGTDDALNARNRRFADSPLEGTGFELPVPHRFGRIDRTRTSFQRERHKDEGSKR